MGGDLDEFILLVTWQLPTAPMRHKDIIVSKVLRPGLLRNIAKRQRHAKADEGPSQGCGSK